MSKPFISACLIVRDEEPTIRRCLECLDGVQDELIVVDTGSIDRTVDIAEEMGARVERFDWCDDFSAARNYACSFATGEWIMTPDGDEFLDGADPAAIVGFLRQAPSDVTNILVEQRTLADGEIVAVVLADRLFRNRADIRWKYRIHEVLDVSNGRTVMTRDFHLLHEPTHKRREGMRVDEGREQMYLRALSADVEAYPDDPRPLFYLSGTLYGAGRHAEALESYERYFEMTEGLEPSRRATAYRDAAAVAGALGDQLKQRAYLFRSIEQDWRPAETYVTLADLALVHENRDEAIHWLSVATACEPPDSAAFILNEAYGSGPWRRLAELYAERGDDALAKACTARARELAEPSESEGTSTRASRSKRKRNQSKPKRKKRR